MNENNKHDERMSRMIFADIYPMYIAKLERKGKTKDELDEIIKWLTGFDAKDIEESIDKKITFEEFFNKAKLNPNSKLITGMICGYRIEEIKNPLTQKIRYLDKLVDELYKGRLMDKILRTKKSP